MGLTKIEWTDFTYNPWIGCTKVSEGCANCYAADLMDQRYGRVTWGKGQPRSRTKTASNVSKWERDAFAQGTFPRVFTASLSDFADPEVPAEWAADLFDLIDLTVNLQWLLLTKHPHRLEDLLPTKWMINPPDNVRIGTSVENQKVAAGRLDALTALPFPNFISAEPLLEGIDIDEWLYPVSRIDWVIAGGESGDNARPAEYDWFRDLRDACDGADVPFFMKQMGKRIADTNSEYVGDKKGGVIDNFPTDLRIRQFPN